MSLGTSLSDIARSAGDPTVLETGPSSRSAMDAMGKRLGLFSIGLGLIEIFGARALTRALGMDGQEALVRAYGVREIVSGMTCLSTETSAGVWSRVAGDALDIATLMTAYKDDNPKKGNVGIALAMVGGVTLLDLLTAGSLAVRHSPARGARRDYSDRSGWPNGLEVARGAAADFVVPEDMRAIPQAASASPTSGRTSPASAGL